MTSAPAAFDAADRRALTIITVVWIVAIVIVNPAGNFPVDDDWSYGLAVRTLLERHAWHPTDFTSMPLVAQAVWGAAFCLPFGFSFTALRISTLVAAWIGLAGVYRLLRRCGGTPTIALLGTLTVLTCPVFFALSFTFMTDVPFLAASVWAAIFALAYIERERLTDLATATALLVVATLVRQLGVGIGVAAGLAVLAARGRRRLGAAAVLIAAPLSALATYALVLPQSSVPAYYGRQNADGLRALTGGLSPLVHLVSTRLLQIFVYAGIFALPVVVFTRRPRSYASAVPASAIAMVVATGGALVVRHHAMPLVGNIWYDVGLNPVIIAGASAWPAAPSALWIVITSMAVVSGAVLVTDAIAGAWRRWQAPIERPRLSLIALALAASLAPLLVINLYDRYLLLPLVLMLALIAGAARDDAGSDGTWRLWVATAVCACAVIFDVAATHDSLAFNRARWTAVRELQRAGVPGNQIDGGFEVNGWLSYGETTRMADGAWWAPKTRPAALLSLSGDGARDGVRYEFHRWLPPSTGVVYARRRRSSE